MVSATAVYKSVAEPRPIGIGWAIALVGAMGVLAIRVVETDGDPLGFVRVLASAFAIGAFFFVRRFSVVRGLLCAVGIEIVTGCALFALVDAPFLKAQAPLIARATVMTLVQLERPSVHGTSTLAKL